MSKKIMHRAVKTHYFGSQQYKHKIFDYNDGVKLDDKCVDDSYVVNVPCYNLEDISMMDYARTTRDIMTYWEKFQFMIRIQTSNHKGKQYQYLIATPEVEKYVAEQTLIGILKGHITKAPKRHLKVVRVHQRGKFAHSIFKKAPINVDAYVLDKFDSDGTLRCVELRWGMTDKGE